MLLLALILWPLNKGFRTLQVDVCTLSVVPRETRPGGDADHARRRSERQSDERRQLYLHRGAERIPDNCTVSDFIGLATDGYLPCFSIPICMKYVLAFEYFCNFSS